MIVEHLPKFISSESNKHSFFFDKNGRFIYIYRNDSNQIPTIIVYNIILNTYVELVADSSIQNLRFDKEKFFADNIAAILPVDTKLLLLVPTQWYPRTVMVFLMRLDFEHKTYGIVDQHLFLERYRPDLVCDEGKFGLFCMSIYEYDYTQNVEPEAKFGVYMFYELTIESKRIKVGRQKELQYEPFKQPRPSKLHLRHDKLWFTRTKNHPRNTTRPAIIFRPRSPPNHYVHISYFDLNEENPVETTVEVINEEEYCVHWIRDLMLLQLNETKFVWFDLTEGRFLETESYIAAREWKTLRSIQLNYTNRHRTIVHAVDNDLTLTALDNTGKLHRILLSEPFKLSEIAWNCVRNSGLVSHVPKSNWPRSPVFEWFIDQKYKQSLSGSNCLTADK
ncbi:hypothetical protein M3Y95_00512300 [Aphelenchoides besseyi]|nr:hypothetical protein M3Y95_00512300 [Aphelenchoides besseyi]